MKDKALKKKKKVEYGIFNGAEIGFQDISGLECLISDVPVVLEGFRFFYMI